MSEWADLVRELTRMRRGGGFSERAATSSPTLLAALNSPPVNEVRELLRGHLAGLGDTERVTALSVALNLDGRGSAKLTDRRNDLHLATGRDPKTLANYENDMIAELAARLLGTRKHEVSESHVLVSGAVERDRLSRVAVTVRYPSRPDGDVFERTVEYLNHVSHASLPGLLYQLPADWRPRALTLTLHFSQDPHAGPRRFYVSAGDELLDLMFATHGGPLDTQDEAFAVVTFENPRPGHLFLLFWSTRS